MTDLRASLQRKRDELVKNYINDSEAMLDWAHYAAGFDAALDITIPMIEKLQEALEFEFDCGDNSCRFVKNKSGMRTNGGCRCFENNRILITKYLLSAREALAELDKTIGALG